jgi:hypothetical protein
METWPVGKSVVLEGKTSSARVGCHIGNLPCKKGHSATYKIKMDNQDNRLKCAFCSSSALFLPLSVSYLNSNIFGRHYVPE